MSKSVAFWLLVGGAVVSIWDVMTNQSLYGPGKPLAGLRWKIWTSATGTNYYLSISDAAVIVGAGYLIVKR